MQGILLTQENRNKILQTGADIATGALDEMIAAWDGGLVYPIFIPDYPATNDPTFINWAVVPPYLFDERFEPVDMEKMKTELVDVVLKRVAHSKWAEALVKGDWVSIGGSDYRVDKPPEKNDYMEMVIRFSSDSRYAPVILMVVRRDIPFEIIKK